MEEKRLEDLKPGDEVAQRVGMSEAYCIHRITRIDAKGIIEISSGARFRANGAPLEKGSKWGRPEPIQPVTDKIRRIIRKDRLVSRLCVLDYNDWKAMDLETLEVVAKAIWKQ